MQCKYENIEECIIFIMNAKSFKKYLIYRLTEQISLIVIFYWINYTLGSQD